MTSEFDSFNESPLGGFTQSPLGARGGYGHVLLWNRQSQFPQSMEDALEIYRESGAIVHTHKTWTEDIGDYFLIIWDTPLRDAPWMAQVRRGAWKGRLHLLGEHSPWKRSNAYINSLTDFHGMSIETRDITCGLGRESKTFAHPLTRGQPILKYGCTSIVRGGTKLAITEVEQGRQYIWLATTTRDGISWVVAGDSNHVIDDVPGYAKFNKAFLVNLVAVPIPDLDDFGDGGGEGGSRDSGDGADIEDPPVKHPSRRVG